MSDNMKKDFHTAVHNALSEFVNMVRIISSNEDIQQAYQNAPKEILQGRTFLEMTMDDAMEVFEWVMRDAPDNTIPTEFYMKLMTYRDNQPVTEAEAQQKMAVGLPSKRNAGNNLPQDVVVPDFMQIVMMSDTPPNLLETFRQNWNNIIHAFGDLLKSDNAHKASDMAETFTENLRLQIQSRMAQQKQNQEAFAQLGGQSDPDGQAQQHTGKTKETSTPPTNDKKLNTLLESYGVDLTEAAKKGEIREVIGRDDEIRSITAAILQKDTPYAMSIGSLGTGKSSVTAGVAQNIARGNVPKQLKDARLIHLKLGAMKAASGQGQTKNPLTGDQQVVDLFNNNLFYILTKVAEHNAQGGPQIILNVDELEQMGGRALAFFQAKDIMKAVMEDTSHLRLIGEITDEGLEAVKKEAPAFIIDFEEIDIAPLERKTTFSILKNEAAKHTQESGITISDELLDETIRMTTDHMRSHAQPGISLKIINSAVALAVTDRKSALEESNITESIANITKLNKEFVGSEMDDRIINLDDNLLTRIYGQDHAIKAVTSALKRGTTGLHDGKRPMGVFLEIGATGVGKTELAKQLAHFLFGDEDSLIKLDMGNYSEKHQVSRITGAPPGYVGFEQPGELDAVRKNPYSVVLFDEIEKAHPDIQNVLLSIMDEGILKTSDGKKIDFRNTVVLMSSNAGAKDAAMKRDKNTLGFAPEEEKGKTQNIQAENAVLDALKAKFTPEFLNRLEILNFKSLDQGVIKKIALKKINEVSDRLRNQYKNINLVVTKEAMDHLVTAGYDPAFGARPMNRTIQKHIEDPLSNWIIKNKNAIGNAANSFNIEVQGQGDDVDDLHFAVTKTKKPAPGNSPAPGA